jgi:hypothetical protein
MRCNKSIGYHHLVGSVFRPNNSRWFAVDRSHAWADEEANACASATYLRRGLCPGRYKNQSNPSCVVARGNLQRARLHSNLRAYPYVRPRRRAYAGREAKRTGVGTPAHSACQDVRAACLMTCSACCVPSPVGGGKAACAARVRNHGAVTAVGYTAAAAGRVVSLVSSSSADRSDVRSRDRGPGGEIGAGTVLNWDDLPAVVSAYLSHCRA